MFTELSQQGQKRLQKPQQRVEVLSVQHQDQAEDLPKLCDVYSTIRLWMLEDDRERHHQAVSLPHKKPQENPANLLAWHYLQPTATRLVQLRQHGEHHHGKAMEMDWARHEERAGQHHSHSPSLDTWMKAQERKTKKHLAPNCGVRAQKLARNQQTWRSFVAALRATRHNGHEMRSCSHNLFIVEYPRHPFQLRCNFLSCQCFRFCSNPKFQKIKNFDRK